MNCKAVLQAHSTYAIAMALSLCGCANVGSNVTAPAPYTQADIEAGRALLGAIEKSRAAATAANISSRAEVEPFHLLGDYYYVGVRNFSSYIIKTSAGVIMIDTAWDNTTDKVTASLAKLGVELTDIKIILITESHADRNQALGYFKERSGAKLYVMDGDVEAIEKGFAVNGQPAKPLKVDVVLHHGDQVRFGNKVLTAYHTPIHTRGTTAWVWQETQNGKRYTVANLCCWSPPGNVVTNANFSTAEIRKGFEVLKSLPVDVPVPFDMAGKLEQMKPSGPNVFVDPQSYRGMIAYHANEFETRLAKQLIEGPPAPTPPRAAASPAGETGPPSASP
jgi:metallo-beta-lactamase class B